MTHFAALLGSHGKLLRLNSKRSVLLEILLILKILD